MLEVLAVGVVLLFAVRVVAVLQGWSKGSLTDHLTGLGFMAVLGCAAAWGMRVLIGH